MSGVLSVTVPMFPEGCAPWTPLGLGASRLGVGGVNTLRWNRAKRSDGKVRLFNYDSLFDSDHAIRSGVVPGVKKHGHCQIGYRRA